MQWLFERRDIFFHYASCSELIEREVLEQVTKRPEIMSKKKDEINGTQITSIVFNSIIIVSSLISLTTSVIMECFIMYIDTCGNPGLLIGQCVGDAKLISAGNCWTATKIWNGHLSIMHCNIIAARCLIRFVIYHHFRTGWCQMAASGKCNYSIIRSTAFHQFKVLASSI